MSVAEFENNLKSEISLNKLIQLLTAGIAVTPEELWDDYQNKNECAKIEYALLEESKVRFRRSRVAGRAPGLFRARTRISTPFPKDGRGSYLLLQTDDLKKDVQLTDADIEKYYNDNARPVQGARKDAGSAGSSCP